MMIMIDDVCKLVCVHMCRYCYYINHIDKEATVLEDVRMTMMMKMMRMMMMRMRR